MVEKTSKPHAKPKADPSPAQQPPPYPWDVFDRAQFERKLSVFTLSNKREMERQWNEVLRENIPARHELSGRQGNRLTLQERIELEKEAFAELGRRQHKWLMASLRSWPGEITRLAYEVMEEQGLAVTPMFYRGLIDYLARPFLISRAEFVIYHMPKYGTTQNLPRLQDGRIDVEYVGLSRIIEQERPKLEIEARKLEYKNENTEPEERPSGAAPTSGFTHSPDFRSVSIGTQSFHLTSQQAQIVELLWSAWQNGTPDIGQEYILQRLGTPTSELRHTFRSRPGYWGKLIVSASKGTVRLNLATT